MSHESGGPEAVARRAAALLLEARASGRLIAPDQRPELSNLSDAYRIQDIVVRTLSSGRRPHGWKLIPRRTGIDPRAAPILPWHVHESPARVSAARFHSIGIEAEIAFRFGRDLPERCTQEEVAFAVSEALVAIEICDTRLADGNNAPALWKLADLQSNAGLVTGTGTRDWKVIDFASQRVELWIDGSLRAQASGTHPTVNPFDGMPWFAGHCVERCGGVRAGDVVTTGSWTGMSYVQPGARVRVVFPSIGEAQVEITR